uniref:E3 ubiquitin ligase BIG BROTHER-related-like n=1 Tax=Erigeron canadensis TaxID=72917 RepID=UPI001CB99BBC|nr:E3 ubiquitin ligase BIG BROTHER-related-like [Erigeron canadensis]
MSTDIEDIHDDYLNLSLPADIPDDLKDFLPQDEEGLTYQEAILQQASVYHSYQECGMSRAVATDDARSNTSSCSSDEEDEDEDEIENESSRDESVLSQEAMDEAYARSLQELGEEFDEFFITEFNAESRHVETSTEQVSSSEASEDDIDPDNMRYEELLNLTETVGVESVGLSAARISQLPISIYTSGIVSNNREENCVICQESFKFGKRVIKLPCSHLYHSKCIIQWLKLKKNCPICQKEVT